MLILFVKEYFFLQFFLDHNSKASDENVFLILKVNLGFKVIYFANDFVKRQRTQIVTQGLTSNVFHKLTMQLQETSRAC